MTKDSVATIAICFEHRSVDVSVATTWGGTESPARLVVGPAPSLHSQQVEIKYKKPTAIGGGGRVKVCALASSRTCAPLTQGFFFRRREFWEAVCSFQTVPAEGQPEKQSHFNGRFARSVRLVTPIARILPYLFSSPRGAGQKSGRFRSDTGGLATQTFARISRTFFLIRCVAYPACERDPFLSRPVACGVSVSPLPRKLSRNSGWGVP